MNNGPSFCPTDSSSINPEYEKQQKRIRALQKQGKVTVSMTKSTPQDSAARKKQMAAIGDAKSRGKGGASSSSAGNDDDDDGVKEVLLTPVYDYVVNLKFTSAGDLKSQLLKVEEVTFGYENQRTLFEDIDFGLNIDSRIVTLLFFFVTVLEIFCFS